MKVTPNAAIIAYSVSAKPAPMLDKNPALFPNAKVRLMLNTAMGPRGAETDTPIATPLIKYCNSNFKLFRLTINYTQFAPKRFKFRGKNRKMYQINKFRFEVLLQLKPYLH